MDKVKNTRGDTDIKYSNYEYDIAKFDITIDSKLVASLYKAQVKQLYIERDFDNDCMPVMLVQISIAPDLYYKICNNAKKTKFTINIYSQKRQGENAPATNRSNYISDTFDPIIPDGTPFTDESLYKKYKETSSSGEGKVTKDDLANDFTFILGKRKNIKATKNIVNQVLTSTNMTDAVCYVLSKSGASNVLMSIFDNTSTYKEVILLPLTLINQLLYLNNTFGFYKQGVLIFFDFDTTYIIRKCSKCTAYRKNEIKDVIFHIYKMSDGKDMDKGSYVDKEKKKAHISVDSQSYHIDDNSSTEDSSIGSNSLMLNDDSTVESINTDGGESYNIITTTGHNKYASQEKKLRLEEEKRIVTINAKNFDLKLLAPNKHYKILCDDSSVAKKLQHNYRLSGYTVSFILTGDTYSTNVSVQLKTSEA